MIEFDESKHPRAEDGRFTDEREFVAEACSAAGVD